MMRCRSVCCGQNDSVSHLRLYSSHWTGLGQASGTGLWREAPVRWIWETGMGSACAPRQGGAIDAGRPLAIWRASFTRNSGIQPKQKQKPSSQRCGKSQRGAEPALPSAPRARMEKTRPSRTTRSRWVGQVTSKSSMGVRVVTHVTQWVGSTELDKNNDIKRRSRKRVPLSSWESFPACAYKEGRGMGGRSAQGQ